jgi:hypothetical protein
MWKWRTKANLLIQKKKEFTEKMLRDRVLDVLLIGLYGTIPVSLPASIGDPWDKAIQTKSQCSLLGQILCQHYANINPVFFNHTIRLLSGTRFETFGADDSK